MQKILNLFFFLFFGGGAFFFASSLSVSWENVQEGISQLKVESLELKKRDPCAFKLFTFGHLPAFLDGVLMSSLQTGNQKSGFSGKHSQLYYGMDLISDLDPLYFEVYNAGAHLLAIVEKDAKGARDLLLKGNRVIQETLDLYPPDFKKTYWQRAWVVPMLLGYIFLFELEDIRKAALYFKQAALYPSSPEYLNKLDQSLSKVGGPFEVGLRLLQGLISQAKDEKIKERLLLRRFHLGVSYEVFQCNLRFEAFKKKHALKILKMSLDQVWEWFLKKEKKTTDSLGGKFYLDKRGKGETTTSHDAVFGIRGSD